MRHELQCSEVQRQGKEMELASLEAAERFATMMTRNIDKELEAIKKQKGALQACDDETFLKTPPRAGI